MEIPSLKLEGRSGCRLEVLNVNGTFHVRKYSKEPSYNDRLLKQATKQEEFRIAHKFSDFLTPEITASSGPNQNLVWFEMTYIHGQKFSEFFERADIQQIRSLAAKFIAFFEHEFVQSVPAQLDKRVITDKILSLEHALKDRALLDRPLIDSTLQYLKRIPDEKLPMKSCHGDFTLSNMLFVENQIYLLDFLDSFIESPMMDLVKFRQDTRFHWSLMIDHELPAERRGKIIQVFDFLDREVVNALGQKEVFEVWYDYLQVFNLLRILPYVEHAQEIGLVEDAIKKTNQITE